MTVIILYNIFSTNYTKNVKISLDRIVLDAVLNISLQLLAHACTLESKPVLFKLNLICGEQIFTPQGCKMRLSIQHIRGCDSYIFKARQYSLFFVEAMLLSHFDDSLSIAFST